MPIERILLAGTFTQRGLDSSAALVSAKDQRFLNCVFNVSTDPITQKSVVTVEKRPGWGTESLVAAGSASTALIKPQAFSAAVSAFGDTNSTIYVGSTSVGVITGRAQYMHEVLISSVSHVLMRSSDGTGWYYVDGAKDQLAYTADGNNSTTITDIKVGGVLSVAGLYVGQKLTAATNIVAGSRIVSINSGAFTAVLDTATTGGAFNDLAITKEPIAKIIDADFVTTGTYISGFEDIDGYVVYTTDDGNLRNSDLNSDISYSSSAVTPLNISPDPAVGLARQRNAIISFGTGSKEVHINAGNLSGSPFQRVPQYFQKVGCLHQRSITTLEDEIFFVSTPRYGDIGVYRIRDMAAEKVSPPVIDRIIGNVATSGAIYANSFKVGGYPYAGFFLSSAVDGPSSMLLLESGDNILLESADDILLEDTAAQSASFVRFLVFNSQLNLWTEWDSQQATFVDGGSSGTSNQLFATSRVLTGGKIYTINPISAGQLYQDDGAAFTCQIRTYRIDHGTGRRKTINCIRLIGDESTGSATLEANDNDYDSDDWYTVGTFDLTQAEPTIYRGGSYTGGRAYRLSHSANSAFRATALEIEFEVGSV